MLRQGICLAVAVLSATMAAQGRPDLINYFGGHRSGINSVAVSEDGTRTATAQVNGPINVFDAATGDLSLVIDGVAKSIAFSPDGQTLIGSDLSGFNVYNAANGDFLRRVEIDNPALFTLNAAAISNDGTRAAGLVSDGTAVLWNLNTETVEKSFNVSGITAASAAFSADGATLAVGSTTGRIHIYTTAGGSLIRNFVAHTDDVTTLSYQGTTIVSGSNDHLVKTWNSQTGNLIRQMSGHSGPVYVARMSANGQYVVSGAMSAQFYLWNANTGGILCALWSHQSTVRAAAFTPDSACVVGGDDGMNVNHWQINGLILMRNYSKHKGAIEEVAISPDGKTVASGSRDGTVKLWRNGALFRMISFGPPVYTLEFSPDNNLIAIGGGVVTRVHDVNSGSQLGFIAHSGVTMGAAFSQDSQNFYSVCTGGELKRAATNGSTQWTAHLGGAVHYVAVPPNGNFVAAATRQWNGSQIISNIHIVNIADGTTFRSWTAHTDAPSGLVFTQDSKLITAFADGTTKAWNPNTGANLWSRGGQAGVSSLDVNMTGDVVLTGELENLRFVRISDGVQLRQYDGEIPERVNSVAISVDERWFAYGMESGTFATAKSPLASAVVGATLVRGSTVSGSMNSLAEQDQVYWRIRPGAVLTSAEAPARVVLTGTASATTSSRFTFKTVVGASDFVLQQDVELFDYQANAWLPVDSRACSTDDQTIVWEQTTNTARFIHPATREVRARLSWKQFAPVLVYPWQARIDQAYWVIVP